jgi:hypothetical protein
MYIQDTLNSKKYDNNSSDEERNRKNSRSSVRNDIYAIKNANFNKNGIYTFVYIYMYI